MNILVTGGAGFIGSHLVEHHLAKKDKVYVVDDLSTGTLDNIKPFKENPDFKFKKANILTCPGLIEAAAWADRIYHMAAVVGMFRVLAEPVKVLAINTSGTERLLRSVSESAKNPEVIIASSSEVYGTNNSHEFREDTNLTISEGGGPRWSYAISKLSAELFGLAYARINGLNVTVVRLFNTIGPRQTGRYGMVVPRFVEKAVSGKPITIFGDGLQSRSFCDVRDIINALDMLASNPETKGEVFNVGNDRSISIQELAEIVKVRSNSSSSFEYIPYEKVYGKEYADIHFRKPSLKKLFEFTGFKPKWKLEETLDQLISEHSNLPKNSRANMSRVNI
ncbi:MAG: NAD-dependent epimerase/dehydratase family protein [Acidobacteriota bacterium]|nr:NAD-dependent epimerase/dehydratase family protein [Acidobacteriota bacterium]